MQKLHTPYRQELKLLCKEEEMKRITTWCLSILILILSVFLISETQAQTTSKLKFRNAEELRAHFKYSPNRIPLVFAHRGGASAGFPENCIETFKHTLETVTPYFEIDPRLTKDSVIVLFHDATLDRTTTGKGKLIDYTWEEVKKLKLKDANGVITNYGIPTLDEALKWSKGKAILMLDRKDVPLEMLSKKIREWKAENRVMVSAYTVEEAKYHYSQNKNIMLEAFMLKPEVIDQYSASGIPWENMVAYVSQPKKKDFYERLHSKGVSCMVFSASVIEKSEAKDKRVNAYRDIVKGGGDIILSNRIKEVADTVYPMRTNSK